MFAPFRRAVLAGTALSVLATALPEPAQAWKPKTHVYLAEEAVRDAADDGRVTIYEVDYTTGKIVGVLGTFEADPRIVDAIRRAPKQFRAGVLGPDAYPDIATGQQVIHPEAAHAIDGHAPGSNAWLTHLWKAGIAHADPRVRAFTIGYLQHAAGDVFAHTYVNHYSGGEFQIAPDPTNGIKHIVLEGYMGKRTPTTVNVFPKLISTGKVCDQRKRDDQNVSEEECGHRSVPGGDGQRPVVAPPSIQKRRYLSRPGLPGRFCARCSARRRAAPCRTAQRQSEVCAKGAVRIRAD